MNRKGFTLIEVVVASVILVIVFTTLTQIVVFSTTYFRDEIGESYSQEDLRLVGVTFEKDIRKYVYQVNEPGSNYFTDDGTTITLGNDNPDTNNNNGCYVKYVFNNSNNTIIREEYDYYTIVSNLEVGRFIQSYNTNSNLIDPEDPDPEDPYPEGPYYITLTLIAIPDNRNTLNDIEQTIYLRLTSSGEIK